VWANPPSSLGALAARLDQGGDAVRELDRALYAENGPRGWQGAPLWRQLQHGLHPREQSRPHKDSGLPPLYPGTRERS